MHTSRKKNCMYMTSAVKTVSITATGMKMKKMDARTTIDQSMKNAPSATGAVIGKEDADERKCHRS